MILSGHDSVLGSCHIFRVFGCFLPRWKKFWISLFGRGSRRSSLGFRHNSDLRLTAVNCAYLRFRPQCLNDSTIGTRRSALDYSTSLFRLPQVTVAFHDHGRSLSVAFHSLPQPNPVPSPAVTYGRLPKAIEAKIAFFHFQQLRSHPLEVRNGSERFG